MRRLETEFTFQGLEFEVVGELPRLPKKNRVYILGTEEYIWNGTSFDMIGKNRYLGGNAKVEESIRNLEKLVDKDYLTGNKIRVNNGLPPIEDEPHPTNCKNCGAVLKGSTCEYCGTKYNKRTIKYWANNRVVHEEEI